MSVQFDPNVSTSATQTSTQGYWDDPRVETDALATPGDLNENPLPAGATSSEGVLPTSPILAAVGLDPDNAVPIDGSSTNQPQRTQGQTPDGKTIQIDPLHEGEQVSIARERTLASAGFGQTYVSSDQLVLTTGAGNDDVQVSQRDDGTLDVEVNGESYEVRMAQGQELTLRSGAGNDTISVAPNVSVNIVVDAGEGNDNITTGAGNDRIDGGAGDDAIVSGDGRDDVFGNSGIDGIDAGAGDDVVYGGDGADIMAGGAGVDFLEGGKGRDELDGGDGHDMLSGGLDADSITGGNGDDRVYAGDGIDTVAAATGDTVYAQTVNDIINAASGTAPTVINVELGTARGVTIEGSEAFQQRVGAEIEFLRSSPNGQQMLAEFDAAAANGNTVTIRELANEQNGYAQTLGRGNAEISNGRAGEGSDVVISYNPSFHMDAFPAPVAVLFHEMSHAYNGVNGTFQPGTYRGTGPDSGRVPNAERQAVGLETSAPAFDFDGDPATAATTHNPIHLTENGLRRELGLPDRPSYSL